MGACVEEVLWLSKSETCPYVVVPKEVVAGKNWGELDGTVTGTGPWVGPVPWALGPGKDWEDIG